ncbi:DUF4214 domain-containing protein [Vreelandella aquamarina]|uniref:DUF4214 domain-containing protein n=1 Tax=Vreelandella aquamarina TaxID=77097 RepID=UPI003CFEC08B
MATQESLDLAQTLYVAYYGRPADRAGLNYWADEIDANGVDAMVNAFGNSAEFEARFGNLSNEQLINNLYQQMFGRSAELAGLDFYSAQLANGESTLAEIALDIANGAQNEDATALSNKVAVAANFTAAIDTTEEVLAYAGDSAANSARDFLATVNAETDAETVDVDAQLSSLVQADQDETTAGETFTLTTGIDAEVGTAGDDVFNAALQLQDATDATSVAQTLQAFDEIDGGEGVDRLNARLIDNSANGVSIESVEQLYLRSSNANATLDMVNVSGAEQVWNDRSTADLAVSNVQNDVTVGLNAVRSGDFSVTYAADALGTPEYTQSVVANGAGSRTTNVGLNVAAAGNDVITGLDVATSGANFIDLGTGLDGVATLTVTGDGSLSLSGVAPVALESVVAGDYEGNLTLQGGANTQEVTTGAGDDSITLAAALADEGFVRTGAGDDVVNMGGFNVNAGAVIELGAGDDVVTNLGVVDKDAVIDGGDGIDTLQLQAVAAANVGAFQNFEVFDVAALNKTLDMDILASQNDVTEVVGSAALGGASALTNVGAGVNFRATADMGATELTLTQKTAGEFTVTLDADQASTASATTNNNATTTVDLTNATSVNVVFDSASVNEIAIAGAITNTQTITLETDNAESISIVSGGENAANVLALTDTSDSNGTAAGGDSLLTEIVITGDQDLDLTGITINNTNKLASVDAGALTGDLTVELADLANGAVVTLGSGADTVVVAANAGSATGDIESIVGFEASESTTDADLIAEADVIDFAVDVAVSTAAATGDAQIANGVIEFLGAGPSTLDQAIDFADALVGTDNQAAIFEYVGNSFVFIQDSVNGDSVVELTGVTGVDSLNANADANLYIA